MRIARGLACRWIILMAALGAASAWGAEGEALKLRYPIERRGDARASRIESPGYDSAYALRLECRLVSWARWNLPLFEPVAGVEEVRFAARRVGDSPDSALVRVLERDGSEWSSDFFDLDDDWRVYSFRAEDFHYFRSHDSRKGSTVQLDQAVQVQFVPGGPKEETAVLLIDDVALEPGGPRWTFEESEQVRPMSASDALRERFVFLDTTHRAEMDHARAYAEWHVARLADLGELLRGVEEADSLEGIERRYGEKARRREFAFQRPAPVFRAPGKVDAAQRARSLALLSKRAQTYRTQPKRFDAGDEGGLECWRMSKLYAAEAQADPSPAPGEGSGKAVCQKVRFVEKGRQTVFLHYDLPEVTSTEDRYDTIRFRARIGSKAFNADEALRLRLFSEGGANAWTDAVVLRPDDVKVGAWQTWEVALQAFDRRSSFDSARLRGLAFRIENAPGQAAEFDFCVDWIELACAMPERLALAAIRRDQQAELAKVHMHTLATVDQAYELTQRFSPALRRFWLRADMWRPGHAAAAAPVAKVARGLSGNPPPEPKGFLRVVSDGAVVQEQTAGVGRLSVEVDYAGPGQAMRFEVALFDHAGACVYAAPTRATDDGKARVSTRLEGVYYWWPGCPYLYTLRVGAYGEDGLLDVLEKPLGFCSVVYRESDVSGAMRHARVEPRRDWSAWINGQAWFVQGTRAHLGGTDDPMDGVRLFGDLWVEFQRNYGFTFANSHSPVFLREGIMETASLRAPYQSIANYADEAPLIESYAKRLGMIRDRAARANVLHYAVGNEVELTAWGADLAATYGDDVWQPLEMGARTIREVLGSSRPLSYVRAGQFGRVPDLPSDDMAGVNHYPGRYFGRVEQMAGDLANLSMNTYLRGWPLFIGEWNGPKYSWASSGIGGCTERGSAFYIAKYWDAMMRTPGVAMSSEFVLNWVATAIEDLTTVPIEEGLARRGKYNQFGGGKTAGHVPWIFPDRLHEGHTFDYMRGFHSPVYYLVETPGELAILHTPRAAEAAANIARPLRRMGKAVRIEELTDRHRLEALDANLLILGEAGPSQPAILEDLQSRRIVGAVLPGFPEAGKALVQRRVHPEYPDRMLVTATASDATGYALGLDRLRKAAEALLRIQREAGAVRRLIVFAERTKRTVYQASFNEFATRGFFHDFDDFRERIDGGELFDEEGALCPRYANLGAVVVDLARKMDDAELETLRKLNGAGANVVVSAPCIAANDALRVAWGLRTTASGSLTESLPVSAAWQASLQVPEMGRARPERMARFATFKKGEREAALRVTGLAADGWEAVARRGEAGDAVVLAGRPWGPGGQCFAFGSPLFEVFALHCKVTRSGKTHSLYDRGTACGLERVARVAVNCLRAGMPLSEDAGALRGRIETERSILRSGESLRVAVELTDAADKPVSGATVLATARHADLFANKRRGGDEEYVVLREATPGSGRYAATVGEGGPSEIVLRPAKTDLPSGRRGVVVEIKAWKQGYVLYEGATPVAAN